jgi:hypothetical protein
LVRVPRGRCEKAHRGGAQRSVRWRVMAAAVVRNRGAAD